MLSKIKYVRQKRTQDENYMHSMRLEWPYTDNNQTCPNLHAVEPNIPFVAKLVAVSV